MLNRAVKISLLLPLIVISCTKESRVEGRVEIPKELALLILAQEAREIYAVNPDSMTFNVFGPTGDVPNYIVDPEGDPQDRITVINSGGFVGVPSIEFFARGDTLPTEVPLPPQMNPMEGLWYNGILYFTDFGKTYSNKVYLFDGESVLDSIEVGSRPVGIAQFDDYLFVACTGMDSTYNYGTGSLYRIDLKGGGIDSLALSSGTSELAATDHGLLLLAFTWFPPSFVYRIDPDSLKVLDSLSLNSTFSVIEASDSVFWLGSWEGKLAKFRLPDMQQIEEMDLESNINSIHFDEKTGSLWVSVGGYSGDANFVVRIKEGKIEKIMLSDTDIGIGHLRMVEF
jgi:hypothetical protein